MKKVIATFVLLVFALILTACGDPNSCPKGDTLCEQAVRNAAMNKQATVQAAWTPTPIPTATPSPTVGPKTGEAALHEYLDNGECPPSWAIPVGQTLTTSDGDQCSYAPAPP